MNRVCDESSKNLTPSEVREIDQMIKQELWREHCEHLHFIKEHGREAYDRLFEDDDE